MDSDHLYGCHKINTLEYPVKTRIPADARALSITRLSVAIAMLLIVKRAYSFSLNAWCQLFR